jgi:EAL domain-containing protein (putative c-di-GMP-specific phosphodiesterase class I)
MNVLRGLRDAGVQIGLDDFGTGYSSLVYLDHFPLDFIKIDKALIDRLGQDRRPQAIVAAIIALAHALGLTVVAEGVETPQQVDVLRDLGCDRAQGFFFAKSCSPRVIDDLVMAREDRGGGRRRGPRAWGGPGVKAVAPVAARGRGRAGSPPVVTVGASALRAGEEPH